MIGLLIGMGMWAAMSAYVMGNLYNKVKIHEQWKESLQHRLERVINKMRDIDSRGLFENDDYTGAIFKDLVSTLEEVSDYTDIPFEVSESKLVGKTHGS